LDIFAGFLAVLILIGCFFAGAVFYTAIGAFIGWVVSLTPLGILVEEGLRIFNIEVSGKLPHLGAALGFITGFLKGTITIKKK